MNPRLLGSLSRTTVVVIDPDDIVHESLCHSVDHDGTPVLELSNIGLGEEGTYRLVVVKEAKR